jgi:uncharacterized repeat protein (TIGR03803 family)
VRLSKPLTFIFLAGAVLAAPAILSAACEKAIYTFQGGSDCAPYGALISDPAGNLYGTTYGGRFQSGTVFQLTPGSGAWTETVLHTFNGGNDGKNPVVGLVRDPAGNLYGTAPAGGASNAGVIFEMTPGSEGWTESVIYTFTGGADGSQPYAGLILDQAGNLYGTTSQGGSTNNGVAFKLAPGSGGWTESVLYTFNGTSDGGTPQAPLMFDQAGNLYGTTTQGGAAGAGVAFKLTPANGGWSESVLYAFTGGNDGGDLEAGLVRGQNGILYGTANAQGSDDLGTVFQLRPDVNALPGAAGNWTANALYSFDGGDGGANPNSGLLLDQAGNLDGTAEDGAAGWGVVYRLTPGSNGWSQSVLYTFTGGPDGGFPESSLLQDNAGNLYGTTVAGGQSCGVVYEITP